MSFVFAPPAEIASLEPSFLPPSGPVWILDPGQQSGGASASRPILLRRYEGLTSVLALSAVLRRAAGAHQSRLFAPCAWGTSEGVFWTATPVPGGKPLMSTDLSRLPWQQAVSLWRPLAEAVRAAHGRGVVHGLLSPWNVWYDDTIEKLTGVDLGCWPGERLGQDVHWPAEMQGLASARQPTPATDVYGLARLLIWLALPAEAMRATPNFSGIPAFAIPTLERAICQDPGRRPQRVDELIDATSFASSIREGSDHAGDEPSDERRADVLFRRVHGRETIENKRFGPGLRFHLGPANEAPANEAESTGVFFYEGVDRDVYHSVRWAWEGALINLFDAGVVEDSTKRRFLTSHARCLPVVEPYWPVSVTDVLTAEHCTSRVLVDQREAGAPGRALVFGSLVHGLLEDLSSASPPTLDEALEARLPLLRIDMLASGLGDDDLPALVLDAHKHFENLVKFSAAGGRNDALSRVGWSGRHAEATRYSAMFGLEGRIDLVTEDEHDGLQIIELKTGKPWDGHLSQVRCYTLLWGGLARQSGVAMSGHVLYSANGRMETIALEDTARERRILRARNELVACHRSHVDPSIGYKAPHFMEHPRQCNAAPCRWRKDRCQEQTAMLGLNPSARADQSTGPGSPWQGWEPSLVSRAWAYHAHFNRLIGMERWAENAALGLILQSQRLAERVANRSALADLRVVEVDSEAGRLSLSGRATRLFSPGDFVLAHRGDIDTGHVVKGVVVSTTGEGIVVRSQSAAIAATLPQDGWILDALPARMGHRSALQALYGAIKHRDRARAQVLLDPQSLAAREAMAFEPTQPFALLEDSERALNTTQRLAVARALGAPVGTLIQGPPGTGKTTVIAHLVRELVARGQRVVLCALTNTAVDTMLAKLLDAGHRDFVRVGSSGRCRELSDKLRAQGLAPRDFFSDDLAQANSSLGSLSQALLDTMVIGCTAHGSVGASVIKFLCHKRGAQPFDVAIVDEAGQLTEPMTLGPLNLARRFVLVGDHRQLPPIVENEQAQSVFIEGFASLDAPEDDLALVDEPGQLSLLAQQSASQVSAVLDGAGVGGLDRSLFERLVERLPFVMLEEQYRMNEAIMAFSNAAFYGDRLRAHESVATQALDIAATKLGAITAPEHAVVFVNVDASDDGRTNLAEAQALVETLICLGQAAPAATIGVVSPFRAQAHLLRELLHTALGESALKIDVDTVERFQGSERDVILVSLVKTGRAGDFLSDERRLNVTLTRARKKLIVFGHRPCLELSPLYRRLIEQPQTFIVDWQSSAHD
ncbi:MAG: AAA family ATPase [Bradymonadaceae bacterium]|nr:AAA family ATPase [Lujinxingiaceae bacterium]